MNKFLLTNLATLLAWTYGQTQEISRGEQIHRAKTQIKAVGVKVYDPEDFEARKTKPTVKRALVATPVPGHPTTILLTTLDCTLHPVAEERLECEVHELNFPNEVDAATFTNLINAAPGGGPKDLVLLDLAFVDAQSKKSLVSEIEGTQIKRKVGEAELTSTRTLRIPVDKTLESEVQYSFLQTNSSSQKLEEFNGEIALGKLLRWYQNGKKDPEINLGAVRVAPGGEDKLVP